MTSVRQAPNKGFTLIELLIVVAIIAILAAIAVPNFLEAQTRAKVSRAKADMRSLATAIEAYAVDANRYPIPDDENGGPITLRAARAGRAIAQAGNPEFFETRITRRLTTPIAYISALPNEPFPARTAEEPNLLYHYSTYDYAFATEGAAGAEEFLEYFEVLLGNPTPAIRYFILSHGPDRDHDGPDHEHSSRPRTPQQDDHDHETGGPALYDPTNGTVSNGDILYLGPGRSFAN